MKQLNTKLIVKKAVITTLEQTVSTKNITTSLFCEMGDTVQGQQN
jgi:hypothetical protein